MKRSFCVGTAFVVFLSIRAGGFAQVRRDLQIPDYLLGKTELPAAVKQPAESKGVPLDGPVEAEEYYVGPGDVFMLNVWSSAPIEQQLTVTPEGMLLVPTVGAIDVKEATLKTARERVASLAGKKYPGSTISLALISPRKVTVQITGQVMNEGMQEVYAVQRVANLLEQANSLPSTQITRRFYDQDKAQLRRDASERRIVIRHRDGASQRVDLVKYLLTGKGVYNPYLREGDVVYVPSRSPTDNQIGVYGGVPRSGSVEFVPGDSLSDLVQYGLGLAPRALPEAAVLTRLSVGGEEMDTLRVNLQAIAEGREANLALRPGDRLVVPQEREEREGNAVYVGGEVRRPGGYPITRTSTKLSEVIRMAGGFTPDAYLRGATLLRSKIGDPERVEAIVQERLLSSRTTMPAEDSTYYMMETELRIRGEVVAVNFEKLFVEGDSTEDVTLRNFDRVMIPARTRTVYVFGQVITPGHVPFEPGRSYRYYVDRAGGFTNEAREGDAMVIKASTRTWLDPGETEIEDGDYVWVPKELHRPFSQTLASIAQIATVVASLATVVLVIQNLN